MIFRKLFTFHLELNKKEENEKDKNNNEEEKKFIQQLGIQPLRKNFN